MSPTRRFPIRFSRWLEWLFIFVGLGPSGSFVEVGDEDVRIRMGWGFRLRVPRSSIRSAARWRDAWWAVGIHTNFRGGWLVNGSPKGIVGLQVDPRARGFFFGVPIRPKRVGIGVIDPDGLLAALQGT
jgi:hypothetical protein